MTILTVLYERQVGARYGECHEIECADIPHAQRELERLQTEGRPIYDWSIKPGKYSPLDDLSDDYVDTPMEAVEAGCPPRMRVPVGGQMYQSMFLHEQTEVGVEYIKRFKFFHIDEDRTGWGMSVVSRLVPGIPKEQP